MSMRIVYLEGQDAGALTHWIFSHLIEGCPEAVNTLTLSVVFLWEERSAACMGEGLGPASRMTRAELKEGAVLAR